MQKIKKSLNLIFTSGGSQSQHQDGDFDSYSIVPSDTQNVLEVNSELAVLVSSLSIEGKSISYSNEKKSLFANYFLHKAVSAINV